MKKEKEKEKIKTVPAKKALALEFLPPELHEVYERIVLEYQYHCVSRYGRPFVSYTILADLIKSGWRPTHEPFVENF